MHPRVLEVTQRLVERSRPTRERYLAMIQAAASDGPQRGKLQCANFAHGVAGCGSSTDKQRLRLMDQANVAIVSSYNDMLSAHQPYEHYPEIIKQALREIGSIGQFAGGVPAMCDGVTQGEAGMELSLASREVIAMSTAVALSHNMFDAALLLGICDKIIPGLMIGALRFGHLPMIFVPGGPMLSGISNKEKAPRPPGLRRGQGHARRAAGVGDEVLPQPGHLHLLWHRQHQPGGDGGHGPAPAGLLLRQSLHPAA
ncbi:dihydroxyacid dehydratase/phosphogluconate dehydratase [Pseudomonas psychrotolerans]|nr:dihydroxyacid dehydratase/phosphogluconate dehydratase [Pseudomonas psychrotolerans]